MKSRVLVAFEEFGDAMTERILLVRRTKSPKYIGKWTDLLLFNFLPLHLGVANAPSYLEITGTCCFLTFCHSAAEQKKPQVDMKSGVLVAFREFGDAMTERILLVRRTKSPKYIEKMIDLLLLRFLRKRPGELKAPST